MAEAVERLRIYRRLLSAQVRGHTAYRASFALDLTANALHPGHRHLAVLAMFQVTRTLGGFSAVVQVLVMFGLSGSGFALADLAVGNIEKLRVYVRQGLLDAVLVRPLSVLGQLLALDFTIRRIARLAVAVGVLVVAVSRAGVPWTPARVALVVTAPFSAALFFSGVFVGTATVAFWWIDSGSSRTGSPTAGAISRPIRSPSTADSSGGCSPTRWASRSSPTTRHWPCSAVPIRWACRTGWRGAARWCAAVAVRPRRCCGDSVSATIAARGHEPSCLTVGGRRGRLSLPRRPLTVPPLRPSTSTTPFLTAPPRPPPPPTARHRLIHSCPVIETRGLRKHFTVTRKAGRWRRTRHTVAAVDGIDITVRAGRDARLPRAERRRQVDHAEDVHRRADADQWGRAGLRPVCRWPSAAGWRRRIGVVFGQRSQLW